MYICKLYLVLTSDSQFHLTERNMMGIWRVELYGMKVLFLVNEGIWCVVLPYDLRNMTMKTGKTHRAGYIIE